MIKGFPDYEAGKIGHAASLEVERIPLHAIIIEEGRRPLNEETVLRLMQSISNPEMGLRTPITVRFSSDDMAILVAGRHRLEAVRRLNWPAIPAFVINESEREARLWEIAENLDRADLTTLERSELVAEWIRLTEEKANEGEISAQVAQKFVSVELGEGEDFLQQVAAKPSDEGAAPGEVLNRAGFAGGSIS